MRVNSGVLKKLSMKTGLSVSLLSDYTCVRRRPGRNMARKLAENSNISEIIWLYGSTEEIKSSLNKSKSK